ncbi:CAP domain-containing protein [Roseovarius sp. D22-M7]|uniref:CAP domain-containing protein n=1 Tax=Roseovarius sp. D22-M7 TaxID=3127116 RepID=UPI00300F94B3
MRLLSLCLAALLALAACAAPLPPQLGADGRPVPQLYRISDAETQQIRFRMLDAVNSLRDARGAPPLVLDERLTAAAATHSRDMAVQARPWHFGSDGSSPLERVRRVGYEGDLIGEAISETYESELETLAAWMEDEGTRRVILSPEATRMGFAWKQERSGKIWWTMVLGSDAEGRSVTPGA